jgi:hypothetical protein
MFFVNLDSKPDFFRSLFSPRRFLTFISAQIKSFSAASSAPAKFNSARNLEACRFPSVLGSARQSVRKNHTQILIESRQNDRLRGNNRIV